MTYTVQIYWVGDFEMKIEQILSIGMVIACIGVWGFIGYKILDVISG